MRKYYQVATQEAEASIHIYGDIVSDGWDCFDSDVTSFGLVKEIEALDVDAVNVYINSYGGEVAEGLAIYNALRRHKAKVKTYCDGFACSAASVVFMAGDERVMSTASLLMIHNAWMWTAGDPNELRKQADDLEKITQASINAYLTHVNVNEEELRQMLNEETWLSASDALEKGFCTMIVEDPASKKAANQSVKKKLVQLILNSKEPIPEPEPQEPEQEPDPEPVENTPQKLLNALFGQRKEW